MGIVLIAPGIVNKTKEVNMFKRNINRVLSMVLISSMIFANGSPLVYAEEVENGYIDEAQEQEIVFDDLSNQLEDESDDVAVTPDNSPLIQEVDVSDASSANSDAVATEDVVPSEEYTDFEELDDQMELRVEDLSPEDESAVIEVEGLINDLPNPDDVKLNNRAAIERARSKYDALSDAAKAAVRKQLKTKLEQCEDNLKAADEAAASNEVTQMITNLKDPSEITMDDADAVNQAKRKFDALSVAAQNFVPANLRQKLDDCLAALDDDTQARTDAASITARINALKAPDNLTKSDESTVAGIERDYDALSDRAKSYVTDETLRKLEASRNALNRLAAQEEVDNEINNIIDGVEQTVGEDLGIDDLENLSLADLKQKLGDKYYDDQIQQVYNKLQEIKGLIDKAKQDIANSTSDTERQQIITDLKSDVADVEAEIAQIPTKGRVDATNYEQTLDSYKKPSEVTINDKTAIQELRAAYEALSDEAKGYVNVDKNSSNETYITRLNNLEKALANLETGLEAEKTAAKEALLQREKINPNYYTESGINEPYNGIMDMINSKKYDSAKERELTNILENALNKIDQSTDASKIEEYKNAAIAAAKQVRDKERLRADQYEAKLAEYKKPNDLSLKMDADQVKALKNEYNSLPSYAKKYIDTNKITGSETYKQRLDSLVNRINQLAENEAKDFMNLMDSLPAPQNATLANEADIKRARQELSSMAKEAKAKVPSSYAQKLADLEAKMALEHQKEGIADGFNKFVKDKLANNTYYSNQKTEIQNIKAQTLAQIKNAKDYNSAVAAKDAGIKKINAIKTKGQIMKEKGIPENYRSLQFRTTKQTKSTIYLRWSDPVNMKDVVGFQIYGGRVSKGEWSMLRQVDYRARSAKFTNLYAGTEYAYKLYVFTVVDGEIIKISASPVIFASTRKAKGKKKGKTGTITGVKVKKVGKKKTGSKKHAINVSLKEGKTAKIKAKEKKKGGKVKKRRKLMYETSNPKVCTVSGSGKVKAVGKGKCTIWVYSQSGVSRAIHFTVK